MHPKHILARYGITPKRSLGQNFIVDDNILSKIVAVADLTANDLVLEIGPGIGALTRHLAKEAAQVTAIELDGRLLPILRDELQDEDNVVLLHGDILDWQPDDHIDQPFKVVANIPYYITGAILRHLLSARNKPTLTVLTVQNEVAQRIVAEPGRMSLLSVSVQFYARSSIPFLIKSGAFWPRPDVDSAVVRLELAEDKPIDQDEEEAFFRIVRAGFSQKRKQLQKNLRGLGYARPHIEAALSAAGIDGKRRAETLAVEEWVALFRALS